jgi:hypothetical protein
MRNKVWKPNCGPYDQLERKSIRLDYYYYQILCKILFLKLYFSNVIIKSFLSPEIVLLSAHGFYVFT